VSVDWYDRAGNKISMIEANELLGDIGARQVGSDDIGPYWVSTVFLVLDHQYLEGPPVLYETMVFSKDQRDDPEDHGLTDFDCVRYSTEEEAIAGHDEMCILVHATLREEIPTTEQKPCEK
jgi:hypothetical protein